MKLITFIKSYKLALASVNSKVASWKGVYLGEVTFPENGNSLIKFIFANTCFTIFIALAISSIATLPPHILYTYSEPSRTHNP